MSAVKTSSLCLVPPAETWRAIQKMRVEHDPQVHAWPPHINFLYPFVPESRFDHAAEQLGQALRAHGELSIRFQNLKSFGKVAYLEPECSSDLGFQKLYSSCLRAFPELGSQQRSSFKPHLTVGRFSDEAKCKSFLRQGINMDITVAVSSICLLARGKVDLRDNPFRVMWYARFGATKPRKGPECPYRLEHAGFSSNLGRVPFQPCTFLVGQNSCQELFDVHLQVESGRSLGVVSVLKANGLVVEEVKPGGLLDEWNRSQTFRDVDVGAGDLIFYANGGDVTDRHAKLIDYAVDGLLHLRIQRKLNCFTGQRVRVRDVGQTWRSGTVVELGPIKVKPDGWSMTYIWDEMSTEAPPAPARGSSSGQPITNTPHSFQGSGTASNRSQHVKPAPPAAPAPAYRDASIAVKNLMGETVASLPPTFLTGALFSGALAKSQLSHFDSSTLALWPGGAEVEDSMDLRKLPAGQSLVLLEWLRPASR